MKWNDAVEKSLNERYPEVVNERDEPSSKEAMTNFFPMHMQYVPQIIYEHCCIVRH